jgi:hypothetical protein
VVVARERGELGADAVEEAVDESVEHAGHGREGYAAGYVTLCFRLTPWSSAQVGCIG